MQSSPMLPRLRFVAFKYRGLIIVLLLGVSFLTFRTNLSRVDPTYIFSDTITEDLPMQEYFHSRAMNGELAIWNPYTSSGNPTLGTLQHRFLYPPRILFYVILGLQWGHFAELVFHFLLTLFGTYALLRACGIESAAAVIGVISVLISETFLVSFHGMQNGVASIAWLPIALLSIRRFVQESNLIRSVYLAFSVSMLLYAGHPQSAFYALHACAFFFLGSLIIYARHLRRRPLAFFGFSALVVLLTTILCAPQVLSSLELLNQGLRNKGGLTPEQILAFPLSVSDTLSALYGTGNGTSWSHLTVLFLILSLILAWKSSKRLRAPLFCMILVSVPVLLLSIGTITPFASWFIENYPLGSSFRFPSRASYVLIFPCALFIAGFASALLRSKRSPVRSMSARIVIPILLALLVLPFWKSKRIETQVFLQSWKYVRDFPERLQAVFPDQNEFRFAAICNRSFLPCDKSGLLARRRSLDEYEPANTYRAYLLSTLLSEELRNSKPSEVWLGETRLTYASLGDRHAVDILRLSSVKWILANKGLWLRSSEATKTDIARAGVQIKPEALEFGGVMAFTQQLFGPFATMAMKDHLDSYQIFEIGEPVVPRAYTTNRILPSRAALESFQKMQPSTWKRDVTVIEATDEQLALSRIVEGDHLKPAAFSQDQPEHVRLRVDVKGDSFLVLNDKFYPGWKCTVNGKETPIYAANLLFRAVRLSPGINDVEFHYKPNWLQATLILSTSGYLFILGVIAFHLRLNFRRRVSDSGT
ncbi:MAG: YfhO family protein [Leptospirales bacterium]|nr:YfhO family protein [Leptospirales bacterium]